MSVTDKATVAGDLHLEPESGGRHNILQEPVPTKSFWVREGMELTHQVNVSGRGAFMTSSLPRQGRAVREAGTGDSFAKPACRSSRTLYLCVNIHADGK